MLNLSGFMQSGCLIASISYLNYLSLQCCKKNTHPFSFFVVCMTDISCFVRVDIAETQKFEEISTSVHLWRNLTTNRFDPSNNVTVFTMFAG